MTLTHTAVDAVHQPARIELWLATQAEHKPYQGRHRGAQAVEEAARPGSPAVA